MQARILDLIWFFRSFKNNFFSAVWLPRSYPRIRTKISFSRRFFVNKFRVLDQKVTWIPHTGYVITSTTKSRIDVSTQKQRQQNKEGSGSSHESLSRGEDAKSHFSNTEVHLGYQSVHNQSLSSHNILICTNSMSDLKIRMCIRSNILLA